MRFELVAQALYNHKTEKKEVATVPLKRYHTYYVVTNILDLSHERYDVKKTLNARGYKVAFYNHFEFVIRLILTETHSYSACLSAYNFLVIVYIRSEQIH